MSLGAKYTPTFRTVIQNTTTSREQRISKTTEGRVQIEVRREAFGPADWASLLSFFHSMKSQSDIFRVRDWTDYTAGVILEANGSLTPSTPELIAEGDGVRTVFELTKSYTTSYGSLLPSAKRRIRRPVDPAKVYLDGVEQVSGYTLDYLQGKITFSSAPASGVEVGWSGTFDLPVRFNQPELIARLVIGESVEWNSIGMTEVYE